ncbi:uncharacterized protein PAC_14816 [Phialocephala subalpina]|uniref:Uncharacterized protein n=1 Tax=Phialocephala subalpina TaxID=576137 RepID=A0A1L7XIY9_9HELO|nr:uncharacterized protein PAC_14816 [Phialocephala subalpina]
MEGSGISSSPRPSSPSPTHPVHSPKPQTRFRSVSARFRSHERHKYKQASPKYRSGSGLSTRNIRCEMASDVAILSAIQRCRSREIPRPAMRCTQKIFLWRPQLTLIDRSGDVPLTLPRLGVNLHLGNDHDDKDAARETESGTDSEATGSFAWDTKYKDCTVMLPVKRRPPPAKREKPGLLTVPQLPILYFSLSKGSIKMVERKDREAFQYLPSHSVACCAVPSEVCFPRRTACDDYRGEVSGTDGLRMEKAERLMQPRSPPLVPHSRVWRNDQGDNQAIPSCSKPPRHEWLNAYSTAGDPRWRTRTQHDGWSKDGTD